MDVHDESARLMTRRRLLNAAGMGLGATALGALLPQNAAARAAAETARAKRVIFLFMAGAPSQAVGARVSAKDRVGVWRNARVPGGKIAFSMREFHGKLPIPCKSMGFGKIKTAKDHAPTRKYIGVLLAQTPFGNVRR